MDILCHLICVGAKATWHDEYTTYDLKRPRKIQIENDELHVLSVIAMNDKQLMTIIIDTQKRYTFSRKKHRCYTITL